MRLVMFQYHHRHSQTWEIAIWHLQELRRLLRGQHTVEIRYLSIRHPSTVRANDPMELCLVLKEPQTLR